MTSTFDEVAGRIFDSWTALRIAIQQGCDGAATLEKVNFMRGAVIYWMKENRDVAECEVEDLVINYLEELFNLTVEDGSTQQVSNDLVECFKLCRDGKDVSKFYNLPKLSDDQLVQAKADDEDISCSEDDEDDEKHDTIPQLVPIACQAATTTHTSPSPNTNNTSTSDKNTQSTSDNNRQSTSNEHSSMETEEGSSAVDEDGFTAVHGRRKHKKR